MIEAALTFKLYTAEYKMEPNRKMEFFGIFLNDILAVILNILPVTLPMGRNTVGFSTGANHRIFNLFNFIFLSFFFFILLPFLQFIPTFLMKALNFTNGYFLWNWGRFTDFWKFNKMYQIIAFSIAILMLFTDLSMTLFFFLIFSTIFYFGNLFKGKILFLHHEEKKLDISYDENRVFGKTVEIILNGPFCFKKLEKILKGIDDDTKIVEINFLMVFEYDFVYFGAYRKIFEYIEKRGFDLVITGVSELKMRRSQVLSEAEGWVFEYFGKMKKMGELDLTMGKIV